jgi:hypothetical protein
MTNGRRGRDRSGLLGLPQRPPQDEQMAYLAAATGKRPNRSHRELAFDRITDEARLIVYDVYERHGLPTGPTAEGMVFLSTDAPNTWLPYTGQELPPAAELQPWWALGYASFGRNSEPGFASEIASAVTDHSSSPSEDWLSGFIVGYRIASSGTRWELEFNLREIIAPGLIGKEVRSQNGKMRAQILKREANAKSMVWQSMAEALWARHPGWSKVSVAAEIAKQLSGRPAAGKVSTIRQAINKPDGARATPSE